MRFVQRRRSDTIPRRLVSALESLEDRRLLAANPLDWQPILPLGSLAYQAASSRNITLEAQRDEYSLELDAQQTIALLVQPADTLRASVELLNSADDLIASEEASSVGEVIQFTANVADEPGPFRLIIQGSGGTVGEYAAGFFVGADLEIRKRASFVACTAESSMSSFMTSIS